MRSVVILALLLQASPAGTSRDSWFGADKVKHFFMTAFVQSVSYSALRAVNTDHRAAIFGATAAAGAVGVGKEWQDRRSTRFSRRDLLWNAAGAGTFYLILDKSVR